MTLISRRSLLRAGPLAAAALGAAALLDPTPAAAADGDRLILGHDNQAQSTTSLTSTEPALDVTGGIVTDTFAIRPEQGSEADPGSVSMVTGIDEPQVLIVGATQAGRGGSRGNVGLSVAAPLATAVQATSTTCGVQAQVTGSGVGIRSTSQRGPASVATSQSGDGVHGNSTSGRGGRFAGGAAAVRLVPGTRDTHPTHGQTGDLYVDRTGRLWYCSPSSWVRLA